MTIQQLENKGHVYLEDLKDVIFSASPLVGTVITVTVDGNEILKHRYFADPDGKIHLDLRELVQNRTSISLPSEDYSDYTPADDSWIYLEVKQGNTTYSFTAFGYEDGLRLSLSDIDYLRIPENYRMILTIPNMANICSSRSEDSEIMFIDRTQQILIDTLTVAEHDGYILNWEYIAADLPAIKGNPFRLRIKHKNTPSHIAVAYPELTTPIFEISNGDFEQYCFLTPRGSYENIPMSGAYKHIPEISFDNAKHASGAIKVKEDRNDLYEQNTGWLTKRTAEVLQQLLSSPCIYHLEGNQWRQIIIESPEVTIDKKANIHSFTFSWRHVND